jgi:excisionase family DNA binding protein
MSRNDVLAHKKAVDLVRAAEYLGVSVQSVRRRIKEGLLPAFRVGPRAIRIYVDDLEALKQPIGGAVPSEPTPQRSRQEVVSELLARTAQPIGGAV